MTYLYLICKWKPRGSVVISIFHEGIYVDCVYVSRDNAPYNTQMFIFASIWTENNKFLVWIKIMISCRGNFCFCKTCIQSVADLFLKRSNSYWMNTKPVGSVKCNLYAGQHSPFTETRSNLKLMDLKHNCCVIFPKTNR